MLRIMNPGAEVPQAPPPTPTDQAPPDDPQANPTQPPPDQTDPTQDPTQAPQMVNHKIPPMVAGYMGPEMGPLVCGNCRFFEDPGSCSVVDGPIDPAGICHNFCPDHLSQPTPDIDQDMSSEVPAIKEDTEVNDSNSEPNQ